ncbi:hypothetical protein MFIFM68171_02052 [Madurella fahalii]|uniref:Fructose-1-6-bisphosphatase class 1 C-terminal domain-containing protein n=1 Tax=Madurella fahalii TaxID=1157608 RepID=A0ABQ0G249_9PEZI
MPGEPSPTLVSLSKICELSCRRRIATKLVTSVLPVLAVSVSQITKVLQLSQQVSLVGVVNAFGDDQLNVDVLAENINRTALAACPLGKHRQQRRGIPPSVLPRLRPRLAPSIISSNWSVGSIIGIWDGPSALGQQPAEKMVTSVLGVYGPRTTIIMAVRVPGSEAIYLEAGLGPDADSDEPKMLMVRPQVRLADPPFKMRYLAPANLRAAAEDDKYMALIAHYVQQKYTLRYSGGLVPDVVRALVKKHGIYVSQVTEKSKAKLRRLYELCPIALSVECVGGRAVDPADGKDILAVSLEHCDERAGLVCGTTDKVEFVIRLLLD